MTNLRADRVPGGSVGKKVNLGGLDPNGNLPVAVEADWRGNYPATWYLQSSATIASTTTDDADIYESNDISMYNYHIVENVSPVDAVSVKVSLDGTNYSSDMDMEGDLAAAGLIEPGEFGILQGKFYSILVEKDGTTSEVPLIRYAHSVK